MILQTSKPIALTIGILLILTACVQPPNYAPVKTVNQAIEPDNGYVSKQSPIYPSINPNKPQTTPKSILEKQQNSFTRENPIITKSSSPSPYPYKTFPSHSTDPTVDKGAEITDQNLGFRKPEPLPHTVETSPKIKPINPAVNKNTASKQQTSPATGQQATEHPKNKPIIPSANPIALQENAQTPENTLVISKNNKEKTSIISIANKKMLKLNFQWPLKGKISRNFSQTDGKGIDITGKTGQTVRATEAGKAVYCGQGLAGFGNLVIIKHNETYLSAYANNSRLYIKEGQQIEKGQTIGRIDITSLKRPSLHFEIRKNGKPINPLTLLPKH